MKTKTLVSLLTLTCSAGAFAASDSSETATRQLQIFPKNLARQHVGTNLRYFESASQSYAATEAAAAWLDDDVATRYALLPGKQHYLLVLSEPQLLTNFCVEGSPAVGTVTLYAGDAPAAPGSKSWSVVAKDVPFESLNGKRLPKSFSRFAKYLLIETDIADPGPLNSVYLYGDQASVSYSLQKRDQPIDTSAVFGAVVNNQTSFSVAGLYSDTRVAFANSGDGYVSWQKVIDDNPESSVALAPSTTESGLVLESKTARPITRVSVLADANAKGTLDIFVVGRTAEITSKRAENESAIIKVNNPAEPAVADGRAASLNGRTPEARLVFNGSSPTAAADFPAVEGSQVLARWTPDNGTDNLALHEVNAFSDLSLASYEVAPSLEGIAERRPERDPRRAKYDGSKDGKDFKDPLEQIKELLPSPYLPGSLGFPPVLTGEPTPLSR